MNGFKPCPFCGNKDIIVEMRESFEATRNDFRNKYNSNSIALFCNDCRTDKYTYVGFDVDYEEAVEMAKEKWNTREVSE